MEEWKTLADQSILVDVPVVFKQWKMSFWIEPLSHNPEWRSVLRVGSGVTDNLYGDRNPSIFLKDGKLHATGTVNGDWNYALAESRGKLSLEKHHVEVSHLKVGDDYIFTLSIDQDVQHQVTNTNVEEFANAKLHISDRNNRYKYDAADAKISDFIYFTFPDSHIFVDECVEKSHSCDPNAKCTNTNKSYSCECKAGYEGNGVINGNDLVGCNIVCDFGQTGNKATGLCECAYCGTGAKCSEGTGDNSPKCTCEEGYEPDATITSATHYYCKNKNCK